MCVQDIDDDHDAAASEASTVCFSFRRHLMVSGSVTTAGTPLPSLMVQAGYCLPSDKSVKYDENRQKSSLNHATMAKGREVVKSGALIVAPIVFWSLDRS